MNGAESLVKTLLANGVDTCFANPGTSEMHFVAALDSHPDMRCVLCLFEGGASGAAEGYFRMKQDVAATMFHLAPGFGNAYANLHNARKGGSGIVNIMGDHATRHMKYDSPLRGDTIGISQSVSHWTRSSGDARSVARDGAEAIRAARSRGGQIATLILPADTAWEEGAAPIEALPPSPRRLPGPEEISHAATLLREPGSVLLIDQEAAFGPGLEQAAAIAAATGARLMSPLFLPRLARGAGYAQVQQLPYPVDMCLEALAGTNNIVLMGAKRPVNFFAYPGKPSTPEPVGCQVFDLCAPDMDVLGTLDALSKATGAAGASFPVNALNLPELPTGPLTLEGVGQALAHLLPENAIVGNESVTAGTSLLPPLVNARPHDLLITTGGAIGDGLPLVTGAAIACPDRQVVSLTGDGSAMYTIQSLWTMARERLNIVVVVIANRGYKILRGEMAALGVEDYGRNAQAMFDIENPDLDWCALAKGHGVPSARATTNEEAVVALREGLATDGPFLVEVVV